MKMNKVISRATRLASIPVLALAASAAKADPPAALDRVSLWLGGYYADTEVGLDAKTRDGDISTGHIELDKGHETVGRARLDVLFFDTQGFTFDYYDISHSSTSTISQPFSFQGIPFQVDSTVKGKLDFTAASASYHWWLDTGGGDVFGAGLGATYYRAKLGLAGAVEYNGQTAEGSASWSESAVAPVVTLAYKHAYSDQLRLYVDASGVYKHGGNLSGHIYDLHGGIEWFPWRNVGLGAEYGVSRIKLDRESSGYDANLDIKLDGPSVYARFRF